MYSVWLLNWQAEVYNKAFNQIEEDSFRLSCFSSDYQRCMPCNQSIESHKQKNGTYSYQIQGNGGCNHINGIYCPEIDINGIDAVSEAIETKQYDQYADPNSFVNDTYMTYYLFGRVWAGTWGASICYRTVQGEYASHNAKTDWSFYTGLILTGIALVYIFIGLLIGFLHKIVVSKYALDLMTLKRGSEPLGEDQPLMAVMLGSIASSTGGEPPQLKKSYLLVTCPERDKVQTGNEKTDVLVQRL